MRHTSGICAVFLCFLAMLLLLPGPEAQAQTVSCPEARITLTVPDSWSVIPLSEADDPGLRLFLASEDVTLSVYVDDIGEESGMDIFEVFTGDETQSGTMTVAGVDMDYVFGSGEDGDYRIYSWLDRSSQVQLYFLVSAHPGASSGVIDEIINSLILR